MHDDDSIHRPARRLRIDDFIPARPPTDPAEGRARSGRLVVIAAVLVLAVLWGSLYLIFRDWRSRYRSRAAVGARVAAAIDPLAEVVPEGVDPGVWHRAVADSHAMLADLTGANVLDVAQMRRLRAEVEARVARSLARPGTARDELAGLWDDLSDRAAPIVLNDRHPRPRVLPPRPEKDPRLMRIGTNRREHQEEIIENLKYFCLFALGVLGVSVVYRVLTTRGPSSAAPPARP